MMILEKPKIWLHWGKKAAVDILCFFMLLSPKGRYQSITGKDRYFFLIVIIACLLFYLYFAQTSKLYSFYTPSHIFCFEFLFSSRVVILIYTHCYFMCFLLSFSMKIFSSFIIFIFPYNITCFLFSQTLKKNSWH